jgi:hypothetical protein
MQFYGCIKTNKDKVSAIYRNPKYSFYMDSLLKLPKQVYDYVPINDYNMGNDILKKEGNLLTIDSTHFIEAMWSNAHLGLADTNYKRLNMNIIALDSISSNLFGECSFQPFSWYKHSIEQAYSLQFYTDRKLSIQKGNLTYAVYILRGLQLVPDKENKIDSVVQVRYFTPSFGTFCMKSYSTRNKQEETPFVKYFLRDSAQNKAILDLVNTVLLETAK